MLIKKLTLGVILLLAYKASIAACSVNSPTLMFGFYNPLQTTPTTSTANLNVLCDVATPFTIEINSGNSGGDFNRYLVSGGNKLYYNLYLDNSHTQIWGDGTGGTMVASGASTNFNQTVYGKIPMLQNIIPGVYTDAPIINVIY